MKTKILEATFHLIAQQGYEKTSLSQIAQAVHIQKPSLYYHFKNKEDLFLSTTQTYYSNIFRQPLPNTLDSREDFHTTLGNYGNDILNHFQHNRELQLFYAEVNLQSRRLPALSQLLDLHDEEHHKEFIQFLELGQSLQALPQNLDLSIESQSIYALIFGLTEMMLYQIASQPNTIWENYVNRLISNIK